MKWISYLLLVLLIPYELNNPDTHTKFNFYIMAPSHRTIASHCTLMFVFLHCSDSILASSFVFFNIFFVPHFLNLLLSQNIRTFFRKSVCSMRSFSAPYTFYSIYKMILDFFYLYLVCYWHMKM